MSVSGPTPNWDVVEVRIHKVTSTGVPLNGQIIFSPRVVAAKDLGALTDVLMRPFRAVVVDGVGSVFLPASDDPSISPLPIEYDVDEVFAGGHLPRFVLSVPLSAKASGIDYAAVSPAGVVPPSTPAFVGPAGPTGPAGAPGAAGAAGTQGATGPAGPTGPVAVVRDTGWRKVILEAALYSFFFRRIDNVVFVGSEDAALQLPNPSDGYSGQILPLGFRPSFQGPLVYGAENGFSVRIGSNGFIGINLTTSEGVEDGVLPLLSFPTEDTFPSQPYPGSGPPF